MQERVPWQGTPDGLEAAMAAGHGYPVTGGEHDWIRAADVDRDRVAEMLGTAYTEGRLSRDEYDARLESALSARTYADLDRVVTDLPATQPAVPRPAAPAPSSARTNGLAIASLACGLAQFAFGPLATIPAIVLGHMARSQIRHTGEQGGGLALAGLALGWGAVILGILLIAIGLAIAAGMHGAAVMGLPSGCENRRGQPLDRVAGEVPEHDGRSSGVRVEAHQVPVGATPAEVLDQAAAVVRFVPPPPAQPRGEPGAVGGEGAHRDSGFG